MKQIIFIILQALIVGCGSQTDISNNNPNILHKNIATTIFWVGEDASNENGNISNIASAWDASWLLHYGGIDISDARNGYYPASFIPKENPFYFALPYNDFNENGVKKSDLKVYIPWASPNDNTGLSICKNKWIKITKNDTVAYAQWEDVGPFGANDINYVFGPNNPVHPRGLDVSPAVRDYLKLKDVDITEWQFIDEKNVPDGPWKNIITTSNVNWTR